MRRIYWTTHDIATFVKGFAGIVLIGVMTLPTYSIDWVRWAMLVLVSLLALYALYIYLAVFYIIEEDQLTVFAMWKFMRFKYNEIRVIETAHGKFKNKYGWGQNCIKIKTGKFEFFISPSHYEEFLERLKESKNAHNLTTITKGKK